MHRRAKGDGGLTAPRARQTFNIGSAGNPDLKQERGVDVPCLPIGFEESTTILEEASVLEGTVPLSMHGFQASGRRVLE